MRAFHNSRLCEYRKPYGAVPVGDAVSVNLDVYDCPDVQGRLKIWIDGQGETLVPMSATQHGECVRLSATICQKEPAIVWYNFLLTSSEGQPEYGPFQGSTGGEGCLYWDTQAPSFQMTVYEPRATMPSWYEGGLVYQIFPDRFARGADWEDRARLALAQKRGGPGRVLVDDWQTPPRYHKDPSGRISEWDFYGGTLLGIQEKLDYLADMGVTALYLNPIFEAASNHRYDTANYLNIDPLLGDTQAFSELCETAKQKGIRIILDGVFNHTGCDSIYFDKYGTYGHTGAYDNPSGPYGSWYLMAADGSYTSWWGVDDLPDCNEASPSYREFIFGEQGVVGTWLKAGASGWRLDVADEMPDDFVAGITHAALAAKPDALVVGEVWEDASNKTSYSKLRRYFLGDELDCAMNYYLRDKLLAYLLDEVDGAELTERIETMRENYPAHAFYGAFNMLGTHDTERLLTVLGGAPAKDSLSDEERYNFRLSDDAKGLAKGRLWLAALLQMTLPGVPVIYYGDEAGMQGYADPYNRAPYPWGRQDKDCMTIYRNAIALRRSLPLFETGSYEPLELAGSAFGFVRKDEKTGECAVVLVNSSLEHAVSLCVPMPGDDVTEILGGKALLCDEQGVKLELSQLGSAVLYFHPKQRLGKEPEMGEGVLCHISSLPGPEHHGTLGAPAREFIDWLARNGMRYWQMLPVNPTDQFGSPYAGLSAFAGNIRLLEGNADGSKQFLLDAKDKRAYVRFCTEQAPWLDTYATFCALKAKLGEGLNWQEWPEKYRCYTPALLKDKDLVSSIEQERIKQFVFHRQITELKSYAHEQGIQIIGDMPIYVLADSADVWAAPELFQLDEAGYPAQLAGCPPDQFAQDGQIWGNPCYAWDQHEHTGFAWWLARLRRALELYDVVRLDHFIGFSSYFAIPQGASAREGSYHFGPGIKLFAAAKRELGELPIIAEDLGVITPAVRALMASCGFWGMDVLQFSDQDIFGGYRPPKEKVVYSSTHDTQTLVGWCASRFGAHDASSRAQELLENIHTLRPQVFIAALQDVLGLGDEARMNVPGVAEGNWTWRATHLS